MGNHAPGRFRVLDRILLRAEYRLLLPLLGRLPLRAGYRIADWRGALNWMLDREWRSFAVGQRYIRAATEHALSTIVPGLTTAETSRLTRMRFQAYAREEFEAELLVRDRVRELDFSFSGLQPVLEQAEQGKGIVIVTAHYDSFILGMVALALQGMTVNVMTSNVVENDAVDPSVRDFYARKYRSMERYLRGRAVHVEQDLRFFYEALLRGECVVVLADLPSAKPDDQRIWIRFLGQERSFLSGAFRLARRTRSTLAGFVCEAKQPGSYAVSFSDCISPGALTEASFQRLYAFLEQAILRSPERWLASDLLRAFEVRA